MASPERLKPSFGLERTRQLKLLQLYLCQITFWSGSEGANELWERDDVGFGGVLEKQRRRGSGWQPCRMSDSASSSESGGQGENGV